MVADVLIFIQHSAPPLAYGNALDFRYFLTTMFSLGRRRDSSRKSDTRCPLYWLHR